MAIQSFQLDPAAQSYSDNDIVDKVNSATNSITREDALDQDSLNIVKTAPVSGEFPVKNIHRTSDGKLDVEYDDVAVT